MLQYADCRMEEDMLGVWLDYLKMLKDTPSKTERLAKAHEVFGMIGSKAIIKLANNYDTLIKHIEDAHEDMLTGITLEREFAKALDTTTAKLQMLDNQIEAAKIRLGEKLAPVTMAMKKITLGFYEALAGPEPGHYGDVITVVSNNVRNLLLGTMKITDSTEEYHSILTETNGALRTQNELIHAIVKSRGGDMSALGQLKMALNLANEEEKESIIKNIDTLLDELENFIKSYKIIYLPVTVVGELVFGALNSAKNICCKAKVDNPEIDSYIISNNKVICSIGESNKITC